MLSAGIERRVGTAELARAAEGAVLGSLGNVSPDKALPAAVKAQADLNDRLGVEVARLGALAERLSAMSGCAEPTCTNGSANAAGLLSELGQEQARTSRLITVLGTLNDHLEKLI